MSLLGLAYKKKKILDSSTSDTAYIKHYKPMPKYRQSLAQDTIISPSSNSERTYSCCEWVVQNTNY